MNHLDQISHKGARGNVESWFEQLNAKTVASLNQEKLPYDSKRKILSDALNKMSAKIGPIGNTGKTLDYFIQIDD